MLQINEAMILKEIDKLALDHLFSIGAIVEKVDRPPHKVKSPKIPKGRIGWKRLNPSNSGSCHQCGGSDGGRNSWPYNMRLCYSCATVHMHSLARGLVKTDEITW